MISVRQNLLAVLLGCGLLISGCAVPEQNAPQTAFESDIANPPGIEDETDHACSYFYFLWGRHAELAGKNEEALEAYEKTLICDASAETALRKIPLLLVRLGRADEAIVKLEEYLAAHPGESSSRMMLAKIYISRQLYKEAAAQYRKVHELDPENLTSLLLLSELYLTDGKKDLARYTLENVLEINSQSYPAHVLLARLLISDKEYDQSLIHYQRALEIDWSADLQLELAEGYIKTRQYRKAVQLYKDLLARDEFNEKARIALVHVYLLQNKENQAFKELSHLKAISSRPDRVDLTIARLYARKKDYNKAIAILSDLLKKEDTGETRYLLAILHYQTEEFEECLRDLQGISRNAEEYEDSIFLQVRALRELKRDEQAIQLVESALAEKEGRNPDMFVLLASLYQLKKQEELGLKTFERGIKAYPDDDKLLYEYGLFLDYRGEYQQALDVMEKVIKLKPEHAAALNYVGYTWADKKVHLDKALSYIKRAVELKPDNGYIRDSLGWVYYRQGKLDLAITALQQAVQLSPDDPSILDHLGDVYLESGHIQDALQAYKDALKMFTKDEDLDRIRKKIRILEEQENN